METLAAGSASRVTIKDVAEMACVSIATVSYVVNRRGRVSPATEARVREAISTLKWEPDPNARRLGRHHREIR